MKTNYLIDEYCIQTLPFTLSSDAKTTLNTHLQFAIESLSEKYPEVFPNFKVEHVAIARDGTIIDNRKVDPKKYRRKHLDFSFECPLIKSIVIKADELNLLNPEISNEFDQGIKMFGMKNLNYLIQDIQILMHLI